MNLRLFVLGIFFVALVGTEFATAQDFGGTSVASSFRVAGDVVDGDLVSYNPQAQTYLRSERYGDVNLFGVAVFDPVLHLTSGTNATGTVPIVRFGEIRVNVTDETGAIGPGDLVTSSAYPGFGARLGRETAAFMAGVALESARYEETQNLAREVSPAVRTGTVLVALRLGYYDPAQGTTTSETERGAKGASTAGYAEDEANTQALLDYTMLLRYILAAIVGIAAIVLALRSFGGALSQSIISVGRNPLARGTILSMMLWNSFLILLVSTIGLGIGAAIIFLP